MPREKRLLPLALVAVVIFTAGPLMAQPNVRPGTDVKLGLLESFRSMGRTGSFPNGLNGLAMSTTSCNVGDVDVPWHAAMQEDHPVIAFMATRVSDGRMVQISDRSFVKHGFFALSSSQCTPCENFSDGTFLGVGCSDTYGTGNNGDRFWLGPADEIDVWQGTWEATCSHFDRGEPPVSPPNDCDTRRSDIRPPNEVSHRVEVKDEDLNVENALFYYYSYYVVPGEPESERENNGGSRRFTPSWNGSRWNISVPGSGNPLINGTILQQWDGATIYQNTNGKNDGLVYVAVKVTGPDPSDMYHYEYAIHNRDNQRKVSSFALPCCPSANVSNPFFRDIDDDASNDWSFSRTGSKITFSTADNPLVWNTIYNFAFDSDAAPSEHHSAIMGQMDPGPGLDGFPVRVMAPMGPSAAVDLGFGKKGGNGLTPEFRVCGNLDSGDMADFVLRFAEPSSRAYFVYSLSDDSVPLFGGTLVPFPPWIAPMMTDANGEIMFPVPGGGGPLDMYMQYIIEDPGATFGFSFSNALRANFGL